jgi:hypothetical protein
MFNGEYELLLIDKSLPSVHKCSQISETRLIIKELYELGEISKEDYVKSLLTSIEALGFAMMKIKKEA